jgi:hypothetical protein
MFDDLVFLCDKYLIWFVLLIGACKLLSLVLYKGIDLYYIVSTYFLIFSSDQLKQSTSNNRRATFRKVHNALTVGLYAFLLIWVVVHLTLIAAKAHY